MITFKSHASSSKGNCYTVSDGKTTILLECGLPFKVLCKVIGRPLSEYSACLVTHEHKDHSKCADKLAAAGIPVYMSAGTADALGMSCVEMLENLKQVEIGTISVMPFDVSHDAAEPLGFFIRGKDGDVMMFATDTYSVHYSMPCRMMALECNHDKALLERCDRLPENVRHRTYRNHMDIGRLCKYLGGLDLRQCTDIYLMHLSGAFSRETEFEGRVRKCVPSWVDVHVCDAGR